MPESVDPPLIVTLVLDTVNVGFQHVSSARQEIARFLRENGGHLAQPVSIFLLTNDGLAAHLNCPLTAMRWPSNSIISTRG